MCACLLAAILVTPALTAAGPSIAPGDLALRHDIQRLADYGVISGPSTSWPLAWGPILSDLANYDDQRDLPTDVVAAMSRLKSKAAWETATNELHYLGRIAAAKDPARIRSFQNTPRDEAEISGGVSWIGERLSVRLQGSAVSNPQDEKEFRADGSEIAMALGNFTIAASTMERWWGPAWDSSLILSGNGRPIPAITIDRTFTDAFETKWLNWIGPWDISVIFGRMEKDRAVPNARFFGMRFNFKPIPSIEIGLSRTAQWCGDGRPCGIDTFIDLLLGKDNVEKDGASTSDEPGNQLAGIDVRWALSPFGLPIALYSQFIGEDEAGGFPSRYIGQIGIEGTGMIGKRWTYRWYGEAAATTCNFYETPEGFNCAYNHGIYQTGYRYRGRPIGHGADNDAAIGTLGLLLVDNDESVWHGRFRLGKLNRGGRPDANNTITPVAQNILDLEIVHNRIFSFGQVEIGIGYEETGGNTTIPSSNEARAFIQWRSDY